MKFYYFYIIKWHFLYLLNTKKAIFRLLKNHGNSIHNFFMWCKNYEETFWNNLNCFVISIQMFLLKKCLSVVWIPMCIRNMIFDNFFSHKFANFVMKLALLGLYFVIRIHMFFQTLVDFLCEMEIFRNEFTCFFKLAKKIITYFSLKICNFSVFDSEYFAIYIHRFFDQRKMLFSKIYEIVVNKIRMKITLKIVKFHV